MATKMSSSSSRTTVRGWRRPTQRAPARQRPVEALAAQRLVATPPLERLAERLEPLLDRGLDRVQLLARLAALRLGQLAEGLQQRGERPRLAAEEAVAQRLEGGDVRRRGHRGVELRPQRAGLLTDLLDGVGHLSLSGGAAAHPNPLARGSESRFARSPLPRERGPQALGRAAFADSTSLPKAAMSVAAISASDLRSSPIPAPFRPAMNWL